MQFLKQQHPNKTDLGYREINPAPSLFICQLIRGFWEVLDTKKCHLPSVEAVILHYKIEDGKRGGKIGYMKFLVKMSFPSARSDKRFTRYTQR